MAEEVLEKFNRSRPAGAIPAAGDLSLRQFRFRAGRSTLDAVMEVVDGVHRAKSHDFDG